MIRFYAGIPIIVEGVKIGSVAVVDFIPHPFFANEEKKMKELQSFALAVTNIVKEAVCSRDNDEEEGKSFRILSQPLSISNSVTEILSAVVNEIEKPLSKINQLENEIKQASKEAAATASSSDRRLSTSSSSSSSSLSSPTAADHQKHLIEQRQLVRTNLQEGLSALNQLQNINHLNHRPSSTSSSSSSANPSPKADNNSDNAYNNSNNGKNVEYISVSHFISQLHNSIPSFHTLKKKGRIEWKTTIDSTLEKKLEIDRENLDFIAILLHFCLILILQRWKQVTVCLKINEKDEKIQFVLTHSTKPANNLILTPRDKQQPSASSSSSSSSSAASSESEFGQFLKISDHLVDNTLKYLNGSFTKSNTKNQDLKLIEIPSKLRKVCRNNHLISIVEEEDVMFSPSGGGGERRIELPNSVVFIDHEEDDSSSSPIADTATHNGDDDEGEVTLTRQFHFDDIEIIRKKKKNKSKVAPISDDTANCGLGSSPFSSFFSTSSSLLCRFLPWKQRSNQVLPSFA
jgi:hypothetical protein